MPIRYSRRQLTVRVDAHTSRVNSMWLPTKHFPLLTCRPKTAAEQTRRRVSLRPHHLLVDQGKRRPVRPVTVHWAIGHTDFLLVQPNFHRIQDEIEPPVHAELGVD